jgi:hypothetical protein
MNSKQALTETSTVFAHRVEDTHIADLRRIKKPRPTYTYLYYTLSFHSESNAASILSKKNFNHHHRF